MHIKAATSQGFKTQRSIVPLWSCLCHDLVLKECGGLKCYVMLPCGESVHQREGDYDERPQQLEHRRSQYASLAPATAAGSWLELHPPLGRPEGEPYSAD